MLLKEELGKNIKKIRSAKKMTQEKLAEIIGIDPKSVSKIENGKNYPSSETLSAIAHALDVEFYELFVFEKIKSPQKMRSEILKAIEDEKTLLYLYQMLKLK